MKHNHFQHLHGIRKIGLLSPYGGGNLGDGAIQEAVINNLRNRCPDAQIFGLTLYPDDTEKRHNIVSFPVAANSLPYYPVISSKTSDQDFSDTRNPTSKSSFIKEQLKKIPILFAAMKATYHLTISLFRELGHVIHSYKLLKDYDLLIVSGGGQLDDYWGGPWGHPYSLFKWGLISKATKTKYIFLSVGTCSLNSKLSTFFIRTALRLACYRSYRDQTSKHLLKQMPITKFDPVFPDLAFSFQVKNGSKPHHSKPHSPVIGISPISYLSPHYWPEANQAIHDNYIKTLSSFASELLRKNYSILFFSTAGPDRRLIETVIELLDDDVRVNSKKQISYPDIPTIDALLSNLRHTDYIVASRLHGVIFSHLLNKPVLAISYDRKVFSHMREIGQPELCLDIHDLNLRSLVNKFYWLQSNDHIYAEQIKNKVRSYKASLNMQYEHTLKLMDGIL